MGSAADLFIRIGADVSGIAGKLGQLQKDLSSAFNPAAIGAHLISDGLQALGASVVGFAQDAVAHLGEVEKLNAQTGAALKSTGGAANVTSQQIQDMANSIEATTGVSGEMIQAGSNLLLTFTNVKNAAGAGNDIFNQTTSIMADMSVAMGTDAKGAAMLLGKALNDPTAGMAALKKAGVTFTQSQKDTIKSLQDSGKTMEAQKIILGELTKEFGGSAKAFGTTLPGALAKAEASFENLGDAMLGGFLPAMKAAATFTAESVNKIADVIQNGGILKALDAAFGPATKALILGIGTAILVGVVPPLAVALYGALTTAAVAFGAAATAAAPFIAVGVAIGALAYPIMANWDDLKIEFMILWRNLSEGGQAFYNNIKRAFAGLGEITQVVVDYMIKKFQPIFDVLPEGFKRTLVNIGGTIGKLPDLMVTHVGAAARVAGRAAVDVGASIMTPMRNAMSQVTGYIDKFKVAAPPAFKTVGDAGAAMGGAVAGGAAKAAAGLAAKQAATVKAAAASKAYFAELGGTIKSLLGLSARLAQVQRDFAAFTHAQNEAARAARGGSINTRAMADEFKKAKPAVVGLSASVTAYLLASDPLGHAAMVAGEGFKALGASMQDTVTAVGGLRNGLTTIGETLGIELAGPLTDGAGKVFEFGMAIAQTGTSAAALLPALTTTFGFITASVVPGLIAFGAMVMGTVIPALYAMGVGVTVALGPIGLIALGIAGIIAVGALLVANWGKISSFLGGVWGAISSGAVTAFSAIGNVVGSVFGAIGNTIKGAINLVSSALNFFIGAINRIGFDTPDWLPGGMGGQKWGFNLPMIPMLAEGGLVSSPTMAMVGEGAHTEAVLPLNTAVFGSLARGIVGQMPAMAGSGGGNTYIELNYTGSGSPRDAEAFAEKIVKILRGKGVKVG